MTLIRRSILFLAIFVLDPALAQGPAYSNGLEVFEVRALAGQFAPSNGNTTLEDAISDPVWFTLYDRDNVISIVDAWSGGAADVFRRKLYVHGGGHGDGCYNGIIEFDFSGDTQPVGWSEVPGSLSSPTAIPPLPGGGDSSDGKPASIHSYDGLQFDSATNRFIRVGGSVWSGSGGLTRAAWAFDFDNGTWNRLATDEAGGQGTPASVINVTERRLLHINHGSGDSTATFYDLDSNRWIGAVDIANFTFHHTAVWDPVRNQVLIVRNGPVGLLSGINWSRGSLSAGNFSISGDTAGLDDEGISMFFDPSRDSIWVIGGRAQGRFNKIWEITNLDSPNRQFTITQYPLTGDIINPDAAKGSYGRFVFFDDWRLIGFVTSSSRPAYVIRLPGEGGPPPPPPEPPPPRPESPSDLTTD